MTTNKIDNLTQAVAIAMNVLDQVAIDPALYGMPITNPEHPWHDDIYNIRQLAGLEPYAEPKPALTMDDYVHRYLKVGARGHFAQHLGDAWTRADLSNRRKLEAAFPDIFTIPKD